MIKMANWALNQKLSLSIHVLDSKLIAAILFSRLKFIKHLSKRRRRCWSFGDETWIRRFKLATGTLNLDVMEVLAH
ncbi:hypothetical protein L6452_43411 [Arctium lappa]|uniref:Uncharacterized protein n=1 Tax=Arctium lappa TaxID=4217 RepID=A0ACB8XDD1_ARCLA|nr:hypothetical protein L6452_43411 [Arctium lappa]